MVKDARKGSAEEQYDIRAQTQADILGTFKTFNEIMTGSNPLTKEEIRKLIEKRPERYAGLRAWLDR